MEPEDYIDSLGIDPNQLDDALIRQPQIFQEVSENYALALSKRDEAKEQLQQVDSKLSLQIREEAEASGRKITEKLVESEIAVHPEHRDAHANYLEAKYLADRWDTIRQSFTQRGYMLRELVQLWVTGYYLPDDSSAIEERLSSKARQDLASRAREEMAEERGRRAKLKQDDSDDA